MSERPAVLLPPPLLECPATPLVRHLSVTSHSRPWSLVQSPQGRADCQIRAHEVISSLSPFQARPLGAVIQPGQMRLSLWVPNALYQKIHGLLPSSIPGASSPQSLTSVPPAAAESHFSLSIIAHAQLCLTLCYPMDCSPPGSFVYEISQARILEWVAISSSCGPIDLTCVSCLS